MIVIVLFMSHGRVVRQIARCAKYIIDVLLVLFFFIALAALMGKLLLKCG